MLQLYIDLALSRLARHAIQPIQLYSYTAIHAIQHTALYIYPGQGSGPPSEPGTSEPVRSLTPPLSADYPPPTLSGGAEPGTWNLRNLCHRTGRAAEPGTSEPWVVGAGTWG